MQRWTDHAANGAAIRRQGVPKRSTFCAEEGRSQATQMGQLFQPALAEQQRGTDLHEEKRREEEGGERRQRERRQGRELPGMRPAPRSSVRNRGRAGK